MAKSISLTPLPKEKPVKVETSGKSVTEFLLERSKQEKCMLFGIIDSARNDEVFRYLVTGNVKYKSLFEGTMDVQSYGVSGFLVECKKESPLFHWMTSEAWGTNCCIFFTSNASFDDLFSHFQKFNRVYIEDEDVVLFRYYDPRVLRVYLPSCRSNEIDLFFGEVVTFFAEDNDPGIITVFKKTNESRSEILKISKHEIIVNRETKGDRKEE